MKYMAALLTTCLVLLTLACGADEHLLAGTSWHLHPGPESTEITLDFSSVDDQVKGWTGCNIFKGRYETHSARGFAFIDLGWTEAGCPSADKFAQETAFLDALVHTHMWSASGFSLTLTTKDGETLEFYELR